VNRFTVAFGAFIAAPLLLLALIWLLRAAASGLWPAGSKEASERNAPLVSSEEFVTNISRAGRCRR
jgi:hypothetical protein